MYLLKTQLKSFYLFLGLFLFLSLNFLQADIYYNLFKENIQEREIQLCAFQTCLPINYSYFLNQENSAQISTPDVYFNGLSIFLNYQLSDFYFFQDNNWHYSDQFFAKDQILKFLHKSKYPNHYTLNFNSNPTDRSIDFPYSLEISTDSQSIHFSNQDLKQIIIYDSQNFLINPFLLLQSLLKHNQTFDIPNLDLDHLASFQNSLILDFTDLVNQINLSFQNTDAQIQIQAKYLLPVPTLSNQTHLQVQKSIYTSFLGSNFNRDYNIQNAISKLALIKLEPQQEFSFLDSIGEISKQTGFLDSLVITQQGFDSQAGGGVCQVSSTLYYAALNAGFDILERYNHSKAISYYAQVFDYGLDATIYPGQKDLRFKNPFDFPVFLFSYYFDSTMQTLIIAEQKIPEVELILTNKEVDHTNLNLIELNKNSQNYNSSQPLVVQNYIPQIQTTWLRKTQGREELIYSFYKSQPKILDYSNN